MRSNRCVLFSGAWGIRPRHPGTDSCLSHRKEKPLPRTHAISLLVRSASENRHADLEGLLESPSEPARIRSIAAVALGQLGDAAAEEILKKNAGASDPLVFSTVMRVLGNIGSPSALPAILSASAHVSGYTLEHARFARP